MNRNLRQGLHTLAGLLLLCATRCTPAPKCPECPPPAADTATLAATAVPARMSLSLEEYLTLTADFRTHFQLADGAPIAGAEVEMPWADLEKLIDPSDTVEHGFIFHYGLDKGKLVLGLSPVALTPADSSATPATYTYPFKVPVHTLGWHSIAPTATPYSTWYARYTSAPAPTTGTYFNVVPSIVVRRDDDAGTRYTPVMLNTDVEQAMLPYEQELLRLHTENSPPTPTHYTEYLVIASAAYYNDDTQSYVHSLCLHIRYRLNADPNTAVDALSDRESPEDDPTPFKLRAADLGNLCPPNSPCGSYTVQRP